MSFPTSFALCLCIVAATGLITLGLIFTNTWAESEHTTQTLIETACQAVNKVIRTTEYEYDPPSKKFKSRRMVMKITATPIDKNTPCEMDCFIQRSGAPKTRMPIRILAPNYSICSADSAEEKLYCCKGRCLTLFEIAFSKNGVNSTCN